MTTLAAYLACALLLSASAAFAWSVIARLSRPEHAADALQKRTRHLEKDAGMHPNIHLIALDDEPTYPGRPKSIHPVAT